MTKADRQAFSSALRLLAAVFRAKITPAIIEVYFQALAEFDIADVTRAMKKAVHHNDWFPKPAELRQTIEAALEREYQHKIHAWNDMKRAERGDD